MLKYGIWLMVWLSGAALANNKEGEQVTNLIFIANHNSAIEPDLLDVQAIIRGDQSNWSNGNPIVLVLPGRKAETYERLSLQMFGESGMMMQRRWLKLVFSGRGNPPRYADSEQEIIDLVLNTPDSAAVIRAQYASKLATLIVREI